MDMKRIILLLAFGTLAVGTAIAQAGNSTSPQPQGSPPVTSQTSATPASPTTGANSQMGTAPANNTGAQAAPQGQMNTNPQTNARGINNQGVNNSGTASSSAAPTSPNSTLPSANPQQPQANCNKPIYECPATDIPWARPSSGNNGTPPPPPQ
jgi:hypothetical protein